MMQRPRQGAMEFAPKRFEENPVVVEGLLRDPLQFCAIIGSACVF